MRPHPREARYRRAGDDHRGDRGATSRHSCLAELPRPSRASGLRPPARSSVEGTKPPFGDAVRLAKDHPDLKPYIGSVARELEDAYVDGTRIMLEGTQGTDLSLHHAQYPHVTSRETTASGCLADAGIAPGRVRTVVMVTRTYPIRVGGTSGPMKLPIETKIDCGAIGAARARDRQDRSGNDFGQQATHGRIRLGAASAAPQSSTVRRTSRSLLRTTSRRRTRARAGSISCRSRRGPSSLRSSAWLTPRSR